MRLTELTAKILLLTMGVLLTACTAVQPWERGNLAKPQMALDPHPLQSALRAHNYGSREAAAGGNAAQGGGCGCY
jgi:starvation-inducible outer membrane lipoprotein